MIRREGIDASMLNEHRNRDAKMAFSQIAAAKTIGWRSGIARQVQVIDRSPRRVVLSAAEDPTPRCGADRTLMDASLRSA
jgi:hypothetical protein